MELKGAIEKHCLGVGERRRSAATITGGFDNSIDMEDKSGAFVNHI